MHDVDGNLAHAHGGLHAAAVRGLMLDIGGDVGAVVVVLGPEPAVEELDIQPVGNPAGRFHTGVHEREVDGRSERTAVYPEVHAGRYELLDGAGRPFTEVEAVGGEVVVHVARRGIPLDASN